MAGKFKSISKISILSKIPNLVTEVIRRCPEMEDKIFDLTTENNAATATYQVQDDIAMNLQNSDVVLADPGLLVPYMQNVCDANGQVQWVQSTWAGVEVLMDTASKLTPSFCLTRFAGSFGKHMEEYVVGQVIAWERGFQTAWKSQKEHFWDTNLAAKKYRLLNELTIGVLGVGDIGKAVCKGCKQMGMKVLGLVSMPPSPDRQCSYVDEYYLTTDLKNLLSQCDYVCNTLPKTPSTDHLLSNNILKACSTKSPIFINIGRGNVINDEEIVSAVKKGWIKGAILDVFQEEPLLKSSPLWDLTEIVITPHCSALSFGHEVASLFAENLNLFQTKKHLKFVVNWKTGY